MLPSTNCVLDRKHNTSSGTLFVACLALKWPAHDHGDARHFNSEFWTTPCHCMCPKASDLKSLKRTYRSCTKFVSPTDLGLPKQCPCRQSNQPTKSFLWSLVSDTNFAERKSEGMFSLWAWYGSLLWAVVLGNVTMSVAYNMHVTLCG